MAPRAALCESPLDDQEYAIKAAYIYNFTKFVEWPEMKGGGARPFTIGVVGNDPFGPALPNAMANRTAAGRAIAIERYPDLATLRRSGHSGEILYIALPPDSAAAALAWLAGRHVLTIGDSEEFCSRGGAIGFIKRKNRIRFEINARATEVAGIRMSSKLLRLAAQADEQR